MFTPAGVRARAQALTSVYIHMQICAHLHTRPCFYANMHTYTNTHVSILTCWLSLDAGFLDSDEFLVIKDGSPDIPSVLKR